MARIRHLLRTFGNPLLLIVVIGFGLFACMSALVMYVNIRTSLQQKTAASQGRIVSCHMERSAYNQYAVTNDECRPTVHFTTTSGQDIDFVSSYTWREFHEGNKVAVQYEPDHPQDALIVSEALWYGVEADLLALPLLVVGICCGYLWLRKRSSGGS